jgi:hypothetical protein
MRLKTANNRRNRIPPNGRSWAILSKRKDKKINNREEKWWSKFKLPGAVYHSCTLHPCYVTDIDDDSIYGKSLLDGSEGHGCSRNNCGVYLMGHEEIKRYKKAWDKDGERGILSVYYGSEEAADNFMKEWR